MKSASSCATYRKAMGKRDAGSDAPAKAIFITLELSKRRCFEVVDFVATTRLLGPKGTQENATPAKASTYKGPHFAVPFPDFGGKMIKTINSRSWYCCPHCGKALFPIRADTKVRNMPFRCKACKHDLEVNIA